MRQNRFVISDSHLFCYSDVRDGLLTHNSALKELGSMYDYLAKIILLGPSGTGKYVYSFLIPVVVTSVDKKSFFFFPSR